MRHSIGGASAGPTKRYAKVPPVPASYRTIVRVVAEQFAWNVHYPGPDKVFGKTDVSHVSTSNPIGLDVTDPHAKDDITTLNELHRGKNAGANEGQRCGAEVSSLSEQRLQRMLARQRFLEEVLQSRLQSIDRDDQGEERPNPQRYVVGEPREVDS